MATLYISEFQASYADHGRGGGAAYQPASTDQHISIGGSSTQSSAFGTNTSLVRLHTDAICSVLFSTNPTVTTANARLAANQTEYFAVPTGLSYKVAVISNS